MWTRHSRTIFCLLLSSVKRLFGLFEIRSVTLYVIIQVNKYLKNKKFLYLYKRHVDIVYHSMF